MNCPTCNTAMTPGFTSDGWCPNECDLAVTSTESVGDRWAVTRGLGLDRRLMIEYGDGHQYDWSGCSEGGFGESIESFDSFLDVWADRLIAQGTGDPPENWREL